MNADGAKENTIKTGSGKSPTFDRDATESLSLLTDGDIQALSVHDYITYLRTISSSPRAQALVMSHINVIADRFITDTKTTESDEENTEAEKINSLTPRAFYFIRNQPVPPKMIESLATYVLTDDYVFPSEGMIGILDLIDRNNQKRGEKPANVHQLYHQRILKGLLKPDAIDTEAKLSIRFTWPLLTGIRELLVDALTQAPTDDVIRRVYPLFANYRLGLEPMRQFLRDFADHHKDFEPRLAHIENVLGFDQAPSIQSLASTYKAIEDDFITYEPNTELLPDEVKLITKTFPPGATILDEGFGPGARHMNALQNSGIHVKGIDVVPSNVQRAQADNPSLDIAVGDWHALDFPDGSLDGIYCLGRSICHNTTADDWMITLREMRRVLGSDTGGTPTTKVILDIPELNSGSYRKESEKFAQIARKAGIHEFETGTIHDSADNLHFLDRYVPTSRVFQIMAKVCGFDAKIVGKKQYGSDKAVNVYWELTPNGQPMSYQQYMELYGRDLTTTPTVTIDLSKMENSPYYIFQKK